MAQEWLTARLRLLRAQQGLTLVEAAKKIGIGRDTLSDLERGRRHPVMPTLAKIARGYGVPIEELVSSTSSPKDAAPPSPSPAEEEERRGSGISEEEQHRAEIKWELADELVEHLVDQLSELPLDLLNNLLNELRQVLPWGMLHDAVERALARVSARTGIWGGWQETEHSARLRERREREEVRASGVDDAEHGGAAEAG